MAPQAAKPEATKTPQSEAHEVAGELAKHHLTSARNEIDHAMHDMNPAQRKEFFQALQHEAQAYAHDHGGRHLPGLQITGSEATHNLKVTEQWKGNGRHAKLHHNEVYNEKTGKGTEESHVDAQGRTVTSSEKNGVKTTTTDDHKGNQTVEREDPEHHAKDSAVYKHGHLDSTTHEDTQTHVKDTTHYAPDGKTVTGKDHEVPNDKGGSDITHYAPDGKTVLGTTHSEVGPDGKVTTTNYGPDGKTKTSETVEDPKNHTKDTTVYDHGNKVSETHEDTQTGVKDTTKYAPDGKTVIGKDHEVPNDKGGSDITHYGPDGKTVTGYTHSEVGPDGKITTTNFGADGKTKTSETVEDPAKGTKDTTTYGPDGKTPTGYEHQQTNSDGSVSTSRYDADGNLTGFSYSKQNPDGSTDTTNYNGDGTRVSSTHEDPAKGTKDTTNYGPDGNAVLSRGHEQQNADGSRTVTTDYGNGKVDTTTVDGQGNVTSKTTESPDGKTTTTYSPNGSMTENYDKNHNLTSIVVYDKQTGQTRTIDMTKHPPTETVTNSSSDPSYNYTYGAKS